jgi:hypothetical protein
MVTPPSATVEGGVLSCSLSGRPVVPLSMSSQPRLHEVSRSGACRTVAMRCARRPASSSSSGKRQAQGMGHRCLLSRYLLELGSHLGTGVTPTLWTYGTGVTPTLWTYTHPNVQCVGVTPGPVGSPDGMQPSWGSAVPGRSFKRRGSHITSRLWGWPRCLPLCRRSRCREADLPPG